VNGRATFGKSSRLYKYILAVWVVLVAVSLPAVVGQLEIAFSKSSVFGALLVISSLFVFYFWLNGVKDLVYTFYYYLSRKGLPIPAYTLGRIPKIVMVYATCDDFSEESLQRSLSQEYENYTVVILDDSSQVEYKSRVDQFASEYELRVVRRDNNEGFKAGNLNNFLKSAEFDYFVILDSDEIIPPNFIKRCLDYFYHYRNVGIVQANHIATRNQNLFQKIFSVGIDSHWVTYQTVKNGNGFLSLLGHGALVSRECYEAAGGFPHLVAEDLAFSIEARNAGYFVAFADDVVCEEEFPVSYLAFKKRHTKWTQGNMEFIKRYTGKIARSKMTWFEKLDIFVFTYNLPLTALFSTYVIIHVMILPGLGFSVAYPLWMLIPTVLFLFAPTLNDTLYYWRKMKKSDLLWYQTSSMLLYGSMFFVGLRASLKATFGKAVFHVTPKTSVKVSRWFALVANRIEILMGLALAGLSFFFTSSVLPVILIVAPAVLSVYLTRMHNREGPDLESKYLPRHALVRAREAALTRIRE
jgi:cellulose synthase/poly-beta-1,6-N-acetylglucosamine synthase-like glycosyltransferase